MPGRWLVFSIMLLLATAALACGSGNSAGSPPSSPVAPPATAARAASPTPTPLRGALTVFAAASLTEVFTQVGDAFRQANPGVSIKFNYAGSPALRTQLAQGAPADVFASADQANMDGARQDGSIDGPDQFFAKNRLVVIYPRNSARVQSIQDLARPGLNLVLTDPSVPIGNYARQSLMSREAVDELRLEVGAVATAVVKSTNVIVELPR